MTFDLNALQALTAQLQGRSQDATMEWNPWAILDAASEPSVRRAIQVCSVPLLLEDRLAWNLIRAFVTSDSNSTQILFELKRQSFVHSVGLREWSLQSEARHFFLSRLDREVQRNVHRAIRDWFESDVRSRPDSDEQLIELFSTYHLTPQDEVAGLAKWRHLSARSRSTRDKLTQQFALAEMTGDLQQLGWVSKDNLDPRLFRGIYLYSCRRNREAAAIFREISDTERNEWAVGVAKHCLANLVRKGETLSKEGVDPVRYTEGLLWRAKTTLEQAGDSIGQVHVRTTLATVLSSQGRFRSALELLRENAARAVGNLSQVEMRHLLANTLLKEEIAWPRGPHTRHKRLTEALGWLHEATMIIQGTPEARHELMKVLVTRSKVEQFLGRLSDAEATATEAISLAQKVGDKNQEAYASDRLGRVILAKARGGEKSGQLLLFQRAIDLFRRATALAPDPSGYHLGGLAEALLGAGKVEEASRVLGRVLRRGKKGPIQADRP